MTKRKRRLWEGERWQSSAFSRQVVVQRKQSQPFDLWDVATNNKKRKDPHRGGESTRLGGVRRRGQVKFVHRAEEFRHNHG